MPGADGPAIAAGGAGRAAPDIPAVSATILAAAARGAPRRLPVAGFLRSSKSMATAVRSVSCMTLRTAGSGRGADVSGVWTAGVADVVSNVFTTDAPKTP